MADNAINLTPVDYDPFAGQSDEDFYNASVKAGQAADGDSVSGSVPLTIQKGDSSGDVQGPNQPSSEYATMKPYEPTLREKLTALFAGTDTERPSPERARVAEGLANIIGLTPAGIPMAAQEARQEAGQGNYVQAGLSAMAMMPAGIAAKVAAPIVQAGAKAGQVAVPYVRSLNDIGLYSHAAETAAGLPQAIGTPEQFKSMLLKGGVKPAEIEASGFDTATQGIGKIGRDDVVKLFEGAVPKLEEKVLGYSTNDEYKGISNLLENNAMPKFGSYTLSGGENYREILLKAPKESDAIRTRMSQIENITNDPSQVAKLPRGGMNQINEEYFNLKKQLESSQDFKSSHWDDPNVVAHLRMSDRAGLNGEKILHLEELQSDWGQAGRKEGFKINASEAKALDARKINIENELRRMPANERVKGNQRAEYLYDEYRDTVNKLRLEENKHPSGPYVTKTQDWTDLGLKRALKEVADGGYDRLTWTPGAEQAKRYDLSKQIDELYHWKEDGKIGLSAYGKRGETILDQKVVSEKELSDYVGKEMADKILKGEGHIAKDQPEGVKVFKNADLQVGGEGMKSYYDKIVPTRLKEIVKRLDPSVGIETGGINVGNKDAHSKFGWVKRDDGYYVTEGSNDNLLPTRYATRQEADKAMTNMMTKAKTIPSLSIKITPAMREKIKKGLPAFAVGGLGTGAALNYSLNPVDHDPFKSP